MPIPLSSDEHSISFFSEATSFQLDTIFVVDQVQTWIEQVIVHESCELVHLNFIFCSDDYLLKINKEYLNHDTYTDIITFPFQGPPKIEGDIFISIDRVKDNASKFGIDFQEELLRVVIHGVLHLCGYGDKGEEEEKQMRKKEDEGLSLFKDLYA